MKYFAPCLFVALVVVTIDASPPPAPEEQKTEPLVGDRKGDVDMSVRPKRQYVGGVLGYPTPYHIDEWDTVEDYGHVHTPYIYYRTGRAYPRTHIDDIYIY